MHTYSEARRLADLWVAITTSRRAAVTEVIAKLYGWVFFYDSHEFIRTGDDADALVGNGPFVIDRVNFSLTVFGTSSPQRDLAKYEKSVPPAVMRMRPQEPPTQ